MGAVTEGVADRKLVGVPSVRADLRRAKHAAPKVLDKVVCIGAVALTNAVGDDGLLCTGQGCEDVLVALRKGFVALHPLLLLADEAPQFVKLDPSDPNADHTAVVKLGAALADLKGKLADRLTVDANQASRRTNAFS